MANRFRLSGFKINNEYLDYRQKVLLAKLIFLYQIHMHSIYGNKNKILIQIIMRMINTST